MILLDENIPDDQRQLLRKWRLRPRQIGQDVGRQGMKDKEQIVPFLHKLDHPTFFTLDMGFFAKDFCHDGYCLICLDVSQKEAALFAKRFLRHPAFDTKAKRMGAVIRVGPAGLTVWRSHASKTDHVEWRQKGSI